MLPAMSGEPDAPSAHESTREMLRQLVEARRAAGEYPDDMERWLDRHYAAIVGSVGERRQVLDTRLEDLRHLHLGRGRVITASRLPLGSSLHALVGRAVARQTEAIYQQLHELAHSVDAVLTELVAQMPTVDVRALETRIRDQVVALAEVADRQQTLEDRIARLESRLDAAAESPPGQDAAPV